MLNYNGSSVEQYVTLTLISNELIVRKCYYRKYHRN